MVTFEYIHGFNDAKLDRVRVLLNAFLPLVVIRDCKYIVAEYQIVGEREYSLNSRILFAKIMVASTIQWIIFMRTRVYSSFSEN